LTNPALGFKGNCGAPGEGKRRQEHWDGSDRNRNRLAGARGTKGLGKAQPHRTYGKEGTEAGRKRHVGNVAEPKDGEKGCGRILCTPPLKKKTKRGRPGGNAAGGAQGGGINSTFPETVPPLTRERRKRRETYLKKEPTPRKIPVVPFIIDLLLTRGNPRKGSLFNNRGEKQNKNI